MKDRRPGWDDTTLWAAFAAHADAAPDALAVVDREGERIVSAGELRADANALAARLEDDGLAA